MAKVKNDIAGLRFNRWTILSRDETKSRKVRWLCRCECGTERVVRGDQIIAGTSKSCGCWNSEKAAERIAYLTTTHGHCRDENSPNRIRTTTYRRWASMKSRCSNPNTNRWHLYGGRGIQVCAQWAASFTQFLADMGECPDGMSLDRIDSNGNYEPGNCRWATMEAQAIERQSPSPSMTPFWGNLTSGKRK